MIGRLQVHDDFWARHPALLVKYLDGFDPHVFVLAFGMLMPLASLAQIRGSITRSDDTRKDTWSEICSNLENLRKRYEEDMCRCSSQVLWPLMFIASKSASGEFKTTGEGLRSLLERSCFVDCPARRAGIQDDETNRSESHKPGRCLRSPVQALVAFANISLIGLALFLLDRISSLSGH